MSRQIECEWCRKPFTVEDWPLGRPPMYCKASCRTMASRNRRRHRPEALAEGLSAEAERVRALAAVARNNDHPEAPWVAQMLDRVAAKLDDTAGMVNPAGLFE